MRKLLLFISFTLLFISLKASHLSGGEIEWICVGQDSFLIKTTLYRDCATTYPNPIGVIIKCENGATIASASFSMPSETDITPSCSSACSKCLDPQNCSFPFGIGKFEFEKLFVLSNAGNCCNVIIYISMCCRSSNITTGSADEAWGVQAKLNRCLFPINSSMEFNSDPNVLICINQNTSLDYKIVDHNAILANPNTDSISYSLVENCIYSGSYSYEKPISYWGFPQNNYYLPKGIHMDNRNSLLLFNPRKVEQTVIAVKAKRFKKINGSWIVIAETIRDCQLMVISCSGNNFPVISGPQNTEICAGDTLRMNFTIYDPDINDSLSLNLDTFASGVQWSVTKYTQDSLLLSLFWITSEQDAHLNPYTFMLNAHDQYCPINGHDFKKVQVLVRSSNRKPGFIILKQNCGKYLLEYDYKKVNASKINWLINGDTISQSFKCSLDFNQSGVYPLNINVEDQYGCIQKSTDTFNVQNILKVELPFDTIVCEGDSIQIKSMLLNSTSTVSYLWTGGDTTSYLNTKPLYQDIYIKLSTSNTDGCLDEDSILIKVDNFNIDLSQDTITCPGNPVELRAYPLFDEGQIVSSYKWLDLSCTCPQGTADSIIVYMPGVFSCEAINENGCVALDTIVAVYDEEPKIHFIPIPDICLNDDNVILDSFVYPRGGVWYGQDTVIIQNNIFRVNKAASKSYLIFYSYTDTATNCFAFDKTTVIVKDYPKIKIVQPFAFCNVDSFYDLNNYVSPIKGNWQTNPAIQFAYFFNPTNANQAKPLIYEVTDSNGCSNEKTIDIIINPLPQLDFIADQETGTLPLAVQFTNNTSILSGNIMTYIWHFGDGDSSVIEHPLHTYLIADLYDVKLNAVSDSGCYSELTKEQLIEVFSGIDEQENSQSIIVYPNPATSEVIVESISRVIGIKKLLIYNSTGQICMSRMEVNESEIRIDIEELPDGNYFIKIIDANDVEYLRRFQKQ